MQRGEVWWADSPAPTGRRPVVLVSREEAYQVRAMVTVAPITTTVRGIAVEVGLGPQEGLLKTCVANCNNLTTIPKAWLHRRISTLSSAKIKALEKAIRFALGL